MTAEQRELINRVMLELEAATPGNHDSYVTAVAAALYYARKLRDAANV